MQTQSTTRFSNNLEQLMASLQETFKQHMKETPISDPELRRRKRTSVQLPVIQENQIVSLRS